MCESEGCGVFDFDAVVHVPDELFWCEVAEVDGAGVGFHEAGVSEVFFDGGVAEVLSDFGVDGDVFKSGGFWVKIDREFGYF